MASPEWYYAKDNVQHGPVSAAELRQLAGRGELQPEDLVWREGMDDWIAAKRVKGLFDGDEPPRALKAPPEAPAAEAIPVLERPEAAVRRTAAGPPRHAFDLALDFARGQLTTEFINTTSKIFTFAGHYGLYLAMAVLFIVSLLVGVKTNQINPVFLGAAAVLVLVVLQYAASRFSGALERLNRSTPARMSSTAFPDCFALLHIIVGLFLLVGMAVKAVQTGPLSLAVPAVVTFVVLQYVAILALNPASLNLAIEPEATAGEEAIGVLSFFVKLSLKIVPVAFGVGIVWGTLVLLYACVLLLAPPESPEEIMEFLGPVDMLVLPVPAGSQPSEEVMKTLPAQATAVRALAILIAFAAVPFVTYVYFLLYYLLVDVFRAVLSLPGKLEGLKGNDEGGRMKDD